MQPDRSIATILFTDIVGSTEHLTELGDKKWDDLLRQHNRLIRVAIKSNGGREINTAGDSFLVLFESPATAIQCALAAVDEVRKATGVDIRAGIHTGEIVETDDDIRGIAVHIGARVASKAGPGEVLVSRTTRDLVRGAGLGFESRGTHSLKGVSGEWQLHAVRGTVHRAGFMGEARVWFDRHRTHRATVSIVVFAAVFGLGGLYVIIQDRGRSLGPPLAIAESAGPGIAILPFSVNDPELNRWREGMVDLLSTNLDGAGGLRAIDSRTVLARWRQQASANETADLPTALQVARSSGARYALVGSVVSSGDNMRVGADVYDLEDGTNLGREQIEGAPDSIFGLVDQLSIQVLSLILEEGDDELPTVDLAGITTQSVPALKSYLEGETLFRSSSFREAIPAYEEAVEADSTFALAYYRLSSALGWLESLGVRTQEALAEAARYADRLPERDRNLLEVSQAYHDETRRNATELALTATQRYPDDPEAWFLLGEVYFHRPTQAVATREDQDDAFTRATDLDPSYTPAYIHPLDNAFRYADSTAATRLIEQYEQYAAGTEYDVGYETAYRLLFGDSLGRAQLSILDTLSTFVLLRIGNLLQHPRAFGLRNEVMLRLADRPDAPQDLLASFLPFIIIEEGRLEDGLRALAERPIDNDRPGGVPDYFDVLLALYYYGDVGVDATALAAASEFGPADSLPSTKWLAAALLAIEEGRDQGADSIEALAQEFNDRLYAEGDSAQGREIERGIMTLQARRAMLEGRDEEALRLLDEVFREDESPFVMVWVVELLERMGRSEDAIRYRLVFGPSPWEGIPLGKLYEEVGNRDRALEAYGWVLLGWENADPEFQPMVAEARQAIIRLKGLRRE